MYNHHNNVRNKQSIVNYLWWEHPEYRETWFANPEISSSEAVVAISLSKWDLSVKPPRQYLKIVKSETECPLLDTLFKAESLAPVLSESDRELSTSSKFSGLPSKLDPKPFSTWLKMVMQLSCMDRDYWIFNLKKGTDVWKGVHGSKDETGHEGFSFLLAILLLKYLLRYNHNITILINSNCCHRHSLIHHIFSKYKISLFYPHPPNLI